MHVAVGLSEICPSLAGLPGAGALWGTSPTVLTCGHPQKHLRLKTCLKYRVWQPGLGAQQLLILLLDGAGGQQHGACGGASGLLQAWSRERGFFLAP